MQSTLEVQNTEQSSISRWVSAAHPGAVTVPLSSRGLLPLHTPVIPTSKTSPYKLLDQGLAVACLVLGLSS